MTTSVRLTPQIERTLNEYCGRKGVTKSEVMSQAIVDYIAGDVQYNIDAADSNKVAETSPIYRAFLKGGLIAEGGERATATGGSATKSRVREAVRAKLSRVAKT
jgi:predicted DNA-binding protein